MRRQDRIKACLLGGAVGDALGAAVEFESWDTIRCRHGEQGIRDMALAYGRAGAITDDTQMMLFTAEGLLQAHLKTFDEHSCSVTESVHHALLRWYLTQDGKTKMELVQDGWLIYEKALWSRRAPGMTCMSALGASKQLGQFAANDSKGCGGVMRVAPHAFFPSAFDLAAKNAFLTHGHPTGYQAAGLFADILQRLDRSRCSLEQAVMNSIAEHGCKPGMSETRAIIESVFQRFNEGIRPSPQSIAELGGGWIAEEALAIGLWCALMAEDLEEGVCWAVNHSGDSDSTGLIAGHFLGIQLGVDAIPARWLEALELRTVIEQIAEDIAWVMPSRDSQDSETQALTNYLRQRYQASRPGRIGEES